MDQLRIERLVAEAHVLAEYAVRSGLTPPTSKIYDVLAALESVPAPANQAVLVTELYREIDVLVRAIAPVTYRQLIRRQTPIGYLRQGMSVAMPFVIGALTLLLTLYLAFQSSQLHQADTALREYQEWIAQQPKEKLYQAFKMYRYEHVLNVKEPPLAQLDAYQKLVEEAHQLASKGAAIQGLLQYASRILYFPVVFEDTGPAWFTQFAKRMNAGVIRADTVAFLPPAPLVTIDAASPKADAAASPSRESNGNAKKKGMGVEAPLQRAAPVSSPPGPILSSNCTTNGSPEVIHAKLNLPAFSDIDSYVDGWDCFLLRLHISEEQLSYSPWPVIYDAKLKVNLFVAWLLPGLYGLLGACVFLMRDLVVAKDQRFRSDRTVLSHFSILLRIALGGLAGIIIGWFSVPTPISGSEAAKSISSIPFGIAFLAGFSIDTLFALLDRLNSTIGGSSQKGGTSLATVQ